MRESEAKALLGLPANASPSQSEVKMAYRQKAWESHPDRFPPTEKCHAESKFKLVSEAYSCLKTATRPMDSASVCYRTGFPQKCRGGNHTLIKYPFAVLILGTVFLGGFHASRAYQKQKRACPSHNPFLP